MEFIIAMASIACGAEAVMSLVSAGVRAWQRRRRGKPGRPLRQVSAGAVYPAANPERAAGDDAGVR